MIKKVTGWITLLNLFITLVISNSNVSPMHMPNTSETSVKQISSDSTLENKVTGVNSDGLPILNGVTMKTELAYYGVGTKRILVYWENNTQYSLLFGESWQLEKYDDKKNEWVSVRK